MLQAFGGKLLGTDRGEWIGELLFQDETGGVARVLHENVLGIAENPEGIFVFTGLHHRGTNIGFIHIVALIRENDVVATRLGRIPGAPSNVTRQPDGTTTFLVATDRYDQKKRLIHECYELRGKVVERSLSCIPPKPLGTTKLFEPDAFRRLV
jgi:hypothetical protein